MESNLVHGEGDYYGQPFRLRSWQRAFIYRAYELNPDGSRIVKEALLGVPKGNGKTELAAAFCWAEMAGPVVFDGWDAKGRPVGKRRVAPNIPVAAASFEQADKVFGAAALMAGPAGQGPLREFFDVFEKEIVLKSGEPGRMYRVAAIAGTNDGGLPTFFVADELHEWVGRKERVHTVIANGLAKRKDAWSLNISTAGWDTTSLLARMVNRGKRIADKLEPADPAFLFEWHEYHEPRNETREKVELDFDDHAALAAAIRQANPAADDFLSVDERILRSTQIASHEFRRYYLNQWVLSSEEWVSLDAWNARAVPRGAADAGAEIVLVLDGSADGKSAVLVGATVESLPHVFAVDVWERGPTEPRKKFGPEEAKAMLAKAHERWIVLRTGMNPDRWPETFAELSEPDEALPTEQQQLVAWESHRATATVVRRAYTQFKQAVDGGTLTHEDDPRFGEHLTNATVQLDGYGLKITKDYANSDRHIDLAVAAAGAYDLAQRMMGAASVYEERGLLTVG